MNGTSRVVHQQCPVSAISLIIRDGHVVRGNAQRLASEGEIPFSDAVGVVEATGARVTRFKAGDRVSTTVLPGWIHGPLTAAGFSSPPGVFASHIDRHEDALVGARVIVVSRSGAKLTQARALSACGVIDSVEDPDWDQEVTRLTGGGAELVLDMGLDDSLRKWVRAAAFEGAVAITGVV